MPLSGRSEELQNLSNAELAKLAQDRQRVIYGVDNRKDLYQVHSSNVINAAKAVAALVKAADLVRQSDGSYTLATELFREAYQLCGSEPFVTQPIGCFCSGFLVAPDIVATAGHCVKSQADLTRYPLCVRVPDDRRGQCANQLSRGQRLFGKDSDRSPTRLGRHRLGTCPAGSACRRSQTCQVAHDKQDWKHPVPVCDRSPLRLAAEVRTRR